MNVVITYDISDNKVRSKFHNLLKNLGYNIQKSVFECEMSEYDLMQIRKFCKHNLDFETDSVRIYKICSDCLDKAQVQGTTIKLKVDRWMVI